MTLAGPILRRAVAASALMFLSAVVGELSTAPPAVASLHPRLDAALFGLYVPADDRGGAYFIETDRLPLVRGATFGWKIRLLESAAGVRLREELELPAAPRTWQLGAGAHLSDDGTVAITERWSSAPDGWLENAWSFTDGDPAGVYRLRVFVDDELVQEFRFLADDMRAPSCPH